MNMTPNCTDLDKHVFLKYYNVFNERDIENVDFDAKRKELKGKNIQVKNSEQKILAAELLLENMPERPKLIVQHLADSESPYYSPANDHIVMPLKDQSPSIEHWYGTAFHEHIHSTGAKHRTDRRSKPGFERGEKQYDSQYALEELVAEIGAVFLNAESGIMLNNLKNNAVYIKGWATGVKKHLQKDNKAIFKAAGESQKAAEYILDRDEKGTPKFWKQYEKESGTKREQIPISTGKKTDVSPGKKTTVSKPKKTKDTGAKTDKKLAAKFFKTSDSLENSADKKYKELESTLTNTPKRKREADSKRIDADVMSDKAKYYRAIGEQIEAGTLSKLLKGISSVKSKNHFYLFVKGLRQGGYYDVFRADVPRFKEYTDIQLSSYGIELGLKSKSDIEKAYKELERISGVTELSDEEKKKREIQKLIDEMRFQKIKGFFPTPDELAEKLVYEADIQQTDSVLEPSAGLGNIADAVKKLHPKTTLSVIEIHSKLQNILELKGHKLVDYDFLAHKYKYDKIVMNPPFEKLADTEHVKHAYSLLKRGGRLVSIMSPSGFNRTQKKAEEFQAWFDNIGGVMEELPKYSFKSAFNSTGVSTVMVTIDKPSKLYNPAEKPKSDLELELELEAEAILLLLQLETESIGFVQTSIF